MPSYPGGFYALAEYYLDMRKKMKAKCFSEGKKPEGKAIMGFTIDTQGKVTNIKVIKSDNDEVTKLGQAVLLGMKSWNPGKQQGVAVPVDYVMPVDLN